MRTEMDLIVLKDRVLRKEEQLPPREDDHWMETYELD